MKILISAVMTVFLAVSTIAQADNASVSGLAVDSLGLPSTALLLTEKESGNTRGQYYNLYKEANTDYKAAKCNKWKNRLVAYCLSLRAERAFYYTEWQTYKDYDNSSQGDDETAYLRSYSY